MMKPARPKYDKVSDRLLLGLLREVVSIRAGHCCEFPGCTNTNCSPHHAGGRGNFVKYDPDTCLYLCGGLCGHHVTGAISAHGTPTLFKQAIIKGKVRSREWFDEVSQKENQTQKDTPEFRAIWKERLQDDLRRIAA